MGQPASVRVVDADGGVTNFRAAVDDVLTGELRPGRNEGQEVTYAYAVEADGSLSIRSTVTTKRRVRVVQSDGTVIVDTVTVGQTTAEVTRFASGFWRRADTETNS
jgi:hypothetical protein